MTLQSRKITGQTQRFETKFSQISPAVSFHTVWDVIDNPDFFLGEVGTEYVFTPSKPDETLPRAKMGGERIKIAPNVN
jgi:hypothetical protein